MRTFSLPLALFAILGLAAGCGTGPAAAGSDGGGGGGDSGGSGGAGGGDSDGSGGAGGGDSDGSGGAGGGDSDGGSATIDVQSTDVTLAPGQEVTYCYYFHTKNTTPVAIDKWVSDMTPGSQDLIVFLGGNHADGLSMQNDCGLETGGNLQDMPSWEYASQMAHQEVQLPGDDGTGKPLAQLIQPNTAGQIQMHYVNATDQALTAHVHVLGYALPAGAAYTQTDAYVTYNQDINIPPNGMNVKVSASCPVPQGVKFWAMSTRSHKQSIHTDVMDGMDMVFQSTDWEHPGQQTWDATPFYTFTQPNLTWECTYDNTGSNSGATVTAGSSAQTNEVCMAIGYFFPSTGPKFGLQTQGKCYSL